jgi:hypothetical protein
VDGCCGTVASSEDAGFATVSDSLSDFVDNRRRWPFCVAANGFCALVDKCHGCNIFEFSLADWQQTGGGNAHSGFAVSWSPSWANHKPIILSLKLKDKNQIQSK